MWSRRDTLLVRDNESRCMKDLDGEHDRRNGGI